MTSPPVNLRVNEVTGKNIANNFETIFKLHGELRDDFEAGGGGGSSPWTVAAEVVKLVTTSNKVGIGTATSNSKVTILSTDAAGQLELQYDASNRKTTIVEADGNVKNEIHHASGTPTFNFDHPLEVSTTTHQLKLKFSSTVFGKFTVDSEGRTKLEGSAGDDAGFLEVKGLAINTGETGLNGKVWVAQDDEGNGLWVTKGQHDADYGTGSTASDGDDEVGLFTTSGGDPFNLDGFIDVSEMEAGDGFDFRMYAGGGLVDTLHLANVQADTKLKIANTGGSSGMAISCTVQRTDGVSDRTFGWFYERQF